ncbi:MAG: YigZ family protein [Flavobacteriales bacterium]|jgi:uncharacterized YigZ family protein|nr:YigZ family protein [Flavobacteriales bacterium]
MSTDRYRTLAGEGHGQLREKASRFIGAAFPMGDEDDFKQRLQALVKEHHGARHFCYAWVLGDAGERHRANDAGEPAGTAGRPILNRAQALGLTYCGVVVVRYFGGTLLGKPGLVRAYGEAAALALEAAPVKEVVARGTVVVTCTYAQMEPVRNAVLGMEGEVLGMDLSDTCRLTLAIPHGRIDGLLGTWRAQGIVAERADHLK